MADCYAADLKKACEFHGHVCTGIVFGVRLARAGLNYLGIKDPEKNKDFIVFVEADRCLADAVQAVTGCSLGKRRLKWRDYGKMAASFIDMQTNKGVRIAVNAKQDTPEGEDPVSFWQQFSDEQMFTMEPVMVPLNPSDLPGRPTERAICANCHEKIMDGRNVLKDGHILCKACADGAYYQKI